MQIRLIGPFNYEDYFAHNSVFTKEVLIHRPYLVPGSFAIWVLGCSMK